MGTAELVLIVCVVGPSAGVAGWLTRRRDGERRVYPASAYVAFAGVGVAITLVGALAHTALNFWGGFVVCGLALVSYLTRPRTDGHGS
jgi:hypothetical protein